MSVYLNFFVFVFAILGNLDFELPKICKFWIVNAQKLGYESNNDVTKNAICVLRFVFCYS